MKFHTPQYFNDLRIQFTRNDREAGRINGARAEVTAINEQARTATIRNPRGQTQTLGLDTPRDQHLSAEIQRPDRHAQRGRSGQPVEDREVRRDEHDCANAGAIVRKAAEPCGTPTEVGNEGEIDIADDEWTCLCIRNSEPRRLGIDLWSEPQACRQGDRNASLEQVVR